MNYNEAIKSIEDVLNSDYHYDESLGYQLTSDDFEWLEEAKGALEKQIPKKPICRKYTDDTRCPVCNTFVLIHNKYCIECGQALDWSDTE